MEMLDIDNAESILLELLEEDSDCVPVLNNLGHMHGRYLSEWRKAVEFYERVLQIEPDNAWARDERRRYQRYTLLSNAGDFARTYTHVHVCNCT